MNIPNSFTDAIKRVFFDKELLFYSAGVSKGSLGSNTVVKGPLLESVKGNFSFQSNDAIQEEFGKTVDGIAVITCAIEAQAKLGDFVNYRNADYLITGFILYDSHIKMAVKNV